MGMQKERVASQVAAALESGARVVCRASAPTSGGGHFYPATVLSDMDHTSPLNSAETFGPVVAICAFDGTEAEAVRLANDSEFGLAAYVYTRDLQRASRVAMGIKAGQVGINSWSLAVAPAACPWIGMKSSGFGYHSGADGWRQFSVPKSLIFATEEEVVLPSVWGRQGIEQSHRNTHNGTKKTQEKTTRKQQENNKAKGRWTEAGSNSSVVL